MVDVGKFFSHGSQHGGELRLPSVVVPSLASNTAFDASSEDIGWEIMLKRSKSVCQRMSTAVVHCKSLTLHRVEIC